MSPSPWRRWLGRRDDPKVVYECRRCGTSVDSEAIRCPACGEDAIVRYEIV